MPYKDPDKQKQYLKDHYETNKELYLKRSLARNQEKRDELRRLKSVPCADCGVQYPYYVMQFDHLGDKKFKLGGSFDRKGLKAILEEVKKCEVVCANCHAERSWRRLHERN